MRSRRNRKSGHHRTGYLYPHPIRAVQHESGAKVACGRLLRLVVTLAGVMANPAAMIPRSRYVPMPRPGALRGNAGSLRLTPLAALLVLGGLTAASALSAGPYRMLGNVASGGGGHSQSSRYAIEGTAGQPATQQSDAAGNRYTVEAGFWAFAPAGADGLFADGFEP